MSLIQWVSQLRREKTEKLGGKLSLRLNRFLGSENFWRWVHHNLVSRFWMVTVGERMLGLLDRSLLRNVANVRNWHTVESSLHGNLRHGGDRNLHHCRLQVRSPCCKGLLRQRIRWCIVLGKSESLFVLNPDLALVSLNFVPPFPFTRGMLVLFVSRENPVVFIDLIFMFGLRPDRIKTPSGATFNVHTIKESVANCEEWTLVAHNGANHEANKIVVYVKYTVGC